MRFLEKNVIQYDEYKKGKILEAIKSFPRMKVKTRVRKFNADTNCEEDGKIEEGGEAIVITEIVKENSEVPNRMTVQLHKKIKDVTWWVLIGDTNNNLLGVKKVAAKKRVTLKMQIDVPENLTSTKVHVYLLADSYIGLDQVQQLNFKN